MPIISVMKYVSFIAVFIFLMTGNLSVRLFAAPLEGGYSLAPRTTASPEEKARVYQEARIKVIEASRKYEGVPYRYGGMTANGLDCSGFIGISFKDALGVVLPRSASALYTWAERTSLEKAQPGDLVFFKTDNTGNVTHVGIYLGDRRFIHAASAGSKTGVIYSSLNEDYYLKCFASAGRAFPEAPSNFKFDSSSAESGRSGSNAKAAAEKQKRMPSSAASQGAGKLLVGVSFAPTWNNFFKSQDVIRGFSSQFFIGTDASISGSRTIIGIALKPEYDIALGVLHLPMTLSLGLTEKVSVFAGPVLKLGSDGTDWLGIIGITAAPFILKTAGGEFAPYAEAAWQSYFRGNNNFNFASGFRLSTGIRWIYRIK